MSTNTYKIQLPVFEGPFDLLLFFIERDELDIYDIPIAKITKEFLEYLGQLEQSSLDVASEFLLVAATLMQIKARMLLPRLPVDADGNELDPRQELVEKLLEYKRYRAVLDELQRLEATRLARLERGNLVTEMQSLANKALADVELENLSLFRLLQVYEQVLARLKYNTEKVVHTVVRYNYTIEERQTYLLALVRKQKRVSFVQIFMGCENRLHAIFTFLALLELAQQEKLILHHRAEMNDFDLEALA
jgi:segregation and condensation protein A